MFQNACRSPVQVINIVLFDSVDTIVRIHLSLSKLLDKLTDRYLYELFVPVGNFLNVISPYGCTDSRYRNSY